MARTNVRYLEESYEKRRTKKKQEITWKELESSFATEVIEQSKRKTRKWFTALIITLVALLVTWIFHE